MSDRWHGLRVAFKQPVREDDLENLSAVLILLPFVASVERAGLSTGGTCLIEQRIKAELMDTITQALYPSRKGS